MKKYPNCICRFVPGIGRLNMWYVFINHINNIYSNLILLWFAPPIKICFDSSSFMATTHPLSTGKGRIGPGFHLPSSPYISVVSKISENVQTWNVTKNGIWWVLKPKNHPWKAACHQGPKAFPSLLTSWNVILALVGWDTLLDFPDPYEGQCENSWQGVLGPSFHRSRECRGGS